jgi:hypothetical protein
MAAWLPTFARLELPRSSAGDVMDFGRDGTDA